MKEWAERRKNKLTGTFKNRPLELNRIRHDKFRQVGFGKMRLHITANSQSAERRESVVYAYTLIVALLVLLCVVTHFAEEIVAQRHGKRQVMEMYLMLGRYAH